MMNSLPGTENVNVLKWALAWELVKSSGIIDTLKREHSSDPYYVRSQIFEAVRDAYYELLDVE